MWKISIIDSLFEFLSSVHFQGLRISGKSDIILNFIKIIFKFK